MWKQQVKEKVGERQGVYLQQFYNKSRLSEDQQDMVVRILKENLAISLGEMSSRTGLTISQVRTAYKHLEIAPKYVREANTVKEQEELRGLIEPLYALGKSRREIAEELDLKYGTVVKICKKYELVKGERQPRHGTAVEYDHFGCRCDVCRIANRKRCYRVKEDMKSRPEDIPHGTMTGYWNWECRCAPCRKVGSEVQQHRLATPLETQWNRSARWTEADEAALESYDKTARELAMELGRTTGAVNTRRSGLGAMRGEVEILAR